MYTQFYKSGNVISDNRKFFPTSSLLYEKNVYSVVVDEENNMREQQNYTYGNPLQDDIYAYRYDKFMKGLRDSDLGIIPYTDIKLPTDNSHSQTQNNLQSNVQSNLQSNVQSNLQSNVQNNVQNNLQSNSNSESLCGMDEHGVSVCGKDKKLHQILDPRFNLREAAKNCILLEDHLFQTQRQCHDCILKHLLMIEGFLEEGITLGTNQEYIKDLDRSLSEFRPIFEKIATAIKKGDLTNEECRDFAQQIRKIRKPICQKYATFF